MTESFAFSCEFNCRFRLGGELETVFSTAGLPKGEIKRIIKAEVNLLNEIRENIQRTLSVLAVHEAVTVRPDLASKADRNQKKYGELFWYVISVKRMVVQVPVEENDRAAEIVRQCMDGLVAELRPLTVCLSMSLSGDFINREPDIYWTHQYDFNESQTT
jgi:proteasome lid subunit RPN8/RPN11